MKQLTIIIFFLSLSLSFAQNKDEKLYSSVVANDVKQVEKLLSEKANPNFVKSSGFVSVNLLITAVNNKNLDIVKLLVSHKADINWKDGFQTSALMYAASGGNIDIVKYLYENGADINAQDGDGNTVLSAAKESGNESLIKFVKDNLKY